MFLNMIRFFGPGVADFLRVAWSPDAGGAGDGGNSGAGGAGDDNPGSVGVGGAGAEGLVGREDYQKAINLLADHYRGLPDVVPGMIGGGTVGELEQSLERSRNEFRSLQQRLQPSGSSATAASQVTTPVVPIAPGGGERRTPPATGGKQELSALDKIMLGLEKRQGAR